MQYKQLLLLGLSSTTLAAPTLNLPNTITTTQSQDQLLASLSPQVQRLLIGLGLGTLAQAQTQAQGAAQGTTGVGVSTNGIGVSTGTGVGTGSALGLTSVIKNSKRAALPAADPALLADLSPNAQSLLAALGLGSLAPGVGGAVTAVGDNV